MSLEAHGLLKYLIDQCKEPTGFVGKQMTAIWNHTFRRMTNWGLAFIPFHRGDQVLDIGCGGGAAVQVMAARASQGVITGVDLSAVSVKKAQRLNRDLMQQGRVHILQAPAEQLPFTDASFDKVTAFQTHIYWRDLPLALHEIHRVLKRDGGLYIICEKNKIMYHLQEYECIPKMKELLASCGFGTVTLKESSSWIAYCCTKTL